MAPMRHQGEHFDTVLSRGNGFGFKGVNISSKKSGECNDLQRKQIKINFLTIKCTNRHYAAMIPSEAG